MRVANDLSQIFQMSRLFLDAVLKDSFSSCWVEIIFKVKVGINFSSSSIILVTMMRKTLLFE